MKKSIVIVFTAMLVLSLTAISYAKYVSGFKVVDVVENQVTIQKGNSDPIAVEVDKNTYKIGDKVRYDAKKLKIKASKPKKGVEGC